MSPPLIIPLHGPTEGCHNAMFQGFSSRVFQFARVSVAQKIEFPVVSRVLMEEI
jgi:hypothetical protein